MLLQKCVRAFQVTLFHVHPGMLTGQLAVLTGEPSFFSVSAVKDSVIAKLPRKDFYRFVMSDFDDSFGCILYLAVTWKSFFHVSVMRRYPRMVLNTAHTVVQKASGFTRQIDFALDWTMVEAGKALYK